MFLWRSGRRSLAVTTLRRQMRTHPSPEALKLLLAMHEARGHARSARSSLYRRHLYATPPQSATSALWRQLYPVPWPKTFAQSATRAKLSRSLLYAVARQESSFSPGVVSHAGAVGLTQLLPSVARSVANLYDRGSPTRASLKRPKVNVALGALYLAELSRMFRGNCALITAGYNAGPYAVRRWIKRIETRRTDEFIESIPYRGAARYAGEVCTAAQTYSALYPEWNEMPESEAGAQLNVPTLEQLGPFMVGPSLTNRRRPLDRVASVR